MYKDMPLNVVVWNVFCFGLVVSAVYVGYRLFGKDFDFEV